MIRLLDVTVRFPFRVRDGFRDVVRVRKRAKVPMISFLDASKTIKRHKSRDNMAIDLVLSALEAELFVSKLLQKNCSMPLYGHTYVLLR